MLEVPEKLRDHVAPRRSLPAFVDAPTDKSATRELALIAKAFRKDHPGYKDASPKSLFEKGLDERGGAALKKTRRAAHALLCAPSLDAIRAASIETLAVAEQMAHHAMRDAALTTPIAFARGAADALATMTAALGLDVASNGNYMQCVFVVEDKTDAPNLASDWLPLRHAICAASDAEYAKAKKLAITLRKTLPATKRQRIAYAFPDEPWSREEVVAYTKDPSKAGDTGDICDLLGAVDDAVIARKFIDHVPAHAFDYAMHLPANDALAILAAALPPLLVKPKYGALLKSMPREVATVIALFRTKQAAEILAPYFGHAILGPIVATYFQDNPDLRGALDAIAKGKSKTAEAAQRVLASGEKRANGPIAKDVDVPGVLRDRPWRPAKNARPRVELRLALPKDLDEHIELTDAEREPRFEKENDVRDPTNAELKKWRAEVKKKDAFEYADYETVYRRTAGVEYFRIPREEGLRAWNEGRAHVNATHVEFLAMHGNAAIPGFLSRDFVKWLSYQEVDDEPILPVLARRKNFRRPAIAWLMQHARVAAMGLVPDALGKAGEPRVAAELALRVMAQKGARDPLLEAARTYGADAAKAIAALVSRDPLAIDATAPKPPEFLRRGDLAPVRLKTGARLSDDASDALVEMLRVAPLDPPYAGIAIVRDACDEASLGDLARDLVEQWALAGHPGRFEWMFFAAAHFPSDAGTRRVAQLARDWARRDRKKATRGCTALAAIADDRALLHLAHIAATSRFDDVRDAARALLDEAAAARNLSRDELDDRIVPDLELGDAGTITLSFGKRAFTVTLDEGLRPVVLGEKTFPRANKDDDAALAKAARARFDALKTDAAAIADRQIRRFELAMVQGRTWSAADFAERIARHPLLRHLARRLVREALPAKGAHHTFRVAEDGSLASLTDAAITLGDGRVRLLHPARIREDEVRAWTTLLADYRIAQPFEQLARHAARSTQSAPSNDPRVTRAIKVAATKVLGTLESRGWRRNDRAHVTVYLRAVASGGDARLALSPGISMEDVKTAGEQTIAGVELPVACSRSTPSISQRSPATSMRSCEDSTAPSHQIVSIASGRALRVEMP